VVVIGCTCHIKKKNYMKEVVMPVMLVIASAFSQIRVAALAS
jgi:hypothetical protein